MAKAKLLICTKGKACKKRGSKALFCALEEQIECMGLEDKIKLKKVDCMGMCGRGPAIEVRPDKVALGRVSPDDCEDIVKSLVKKKQKSVKRLIVKQ